MSKKLNRLINKLEIVLGRTRLISGPFNIQIEPTNRCNQKCIMCPRNEDNYDVPWGEMGFGDYKKIVDQFPGMTDLQINGLGEPMLHKNLSQMVEYATRRGVNVSITSNCALTTEELAHKLIDAKLNLIKISMDSPDPEVYRSIRKGDIEPVLKGIKALVKVKKERRSTKPSLWFNSIIMRQNYKQLPKILKLGKDLGVDLVRFKPIDTFDLYQDNNLRVEREELRKSVKQAIEINQEIGMNTNLEKLLEDFDTYYRPKKNMPCFSPWTEVYVQYYAGVRLCCEFYSQFYDVGNILETDFKKIWNSKAMQKIRQEFKKGNTYFPVCQTCNRFQKNILVQDKINKIKFWQA